MNTEKRLNELLSHFDKDLSLFSRKLDNLLAHNVLDIRQGDIDRLLSSCSISDPVLQFTML